MSSVAPTPAELDRQRRRVSEQGSSFLTMGLSVGAIGLAGAALGAVCPLCVVATPALLGAGAVQKLRAALLSRRADVAAARAPHAAP
jgi:flagellar motor component MotA